MIAALALTALDAGATPPGSPADVHASAPRPSPAPVAAVRSAPVAAAPSAPVAAPPAPVTAPPAPTAASPGFVRRWIDRVFGGAGPKMADAQPATEARGLPRTVVVRAPGATPPVNQVVTSAADGTDQHRITYGEGQVSSFSIDRGGVVRTAAGVTTGQIEERFAGDARGLIAKSATASGVTTRAVDHDVPRKLVVGSKFFVTHELSGERQTHRFDVVARDRQTGFLTIRQTTDGRSEVKDIVYDVGHGRVVASTATP